MARRDSRRRRSRDSDAPESIGTDYPAAPTPGGRPGRPASDDDGPNPFLDPLDSVGPLPYAPPPRRSRERRGRAPDQEPREAPSEPPRREDRAPRLAGREKNPRRRGRWILPLAILGLAVVTGVVLLVRALGGPSADSGDEYVDVEELAVVWQIRPEDLDPDLNVTGEFTDGLDGTAETRLVAGDGVWLTGLEAIGADDEYASERPAQLGAVDPATGERLWLRELPGVRCTSAVTGGALTCLAQEGDGGWSAHEVDVATGEDRRTWQVDVASVSALHAVGDGLLVVGESAPDVHTLLSFVASDGSVSWSSDLAELRSADDLLWTYDSPDDGREITEIWDPVWRDVGDSVVLASSMGLVVVDPASGVTLDRSCWNQAVTAEAAYCHGPEGTERVDPDGSIAWHADGPILSNAYIPAVRPLALDDDTVVLALDEATGMPLGELVDLGPETAGAHVSGTPEHTFVNDEDTLVRLTPDGRDVVWSTPVDDLNSIVQANVVGDVVVLDGFPFVGVDLETGEQLWTRSAEATDALVVDGRLVAHGTFVIAVHELP